jgi:hypothetical protein
MSINTILYKKENEIKYKIQKIAIQKKKVLFKFKITRQIN